MDIVDLKQACEEWIRNGRSHEAVRALERLNLTLIPRAHRRSLANLARRADLYDLGLRILTPIMSPECDPTNYERAEYGALLHKIGANDEALEILCSINPDEVPEVLLFQGYCHFGQWNSEAAVAPLEVYCHHSKVTGYQRSLGQLNLLTALVSAKLFFRAHHLIKELEPAIAGRFPRLEASFAQIRAELAILQDDFLEADRQLKIAETFLNDKSSDHLFLRKWRAVMHLVRNGDSAPLRQIAVEAADASQWETVRSCDYQLLKFAGTQKLFEDLYAGTPIAAYRAALVRVTGGRFQLPTVSVRGTGEQVFNLTTGEIDGEDIFARKKNLHKMLLALSADAYRPLRIGGIFLSVFPGEHFDIFSTPDRLHQLMFRLRSVLKSAGGPVDIVEQNRFYRVVVQSDWRMEVPLDLAAMEPAPIVKLRQIFGNKYFSTKSAADSLEMPVTTLRRVLKAALDSNLLVQDGRGPASRYKLTG